MLTLTEDNPPTFRPGDIGSVSVTGLPDMRVGLLAVDQSVYLMNQKTLTRRAVRFLSSVLHRLYTIIVSLKQIYTKLQKFHY